MTNTAAIKTSSAHRWASVIYMKTITAVTRTRWHTCIPSKKKTTCVTVVRTRLFTKYASTSVVGRKPAVLMPAKGLVRLAERHAWQPAFRSWRSPLSHEHRHSGHARGQLLYLFATCPDDVHQLRHLRVTVRAIFTAETRQIPPASLVAKGQSPTLYRFSL